DRAKCHGMVVGPGRGASSCDAPLREFIMRAVLRGQIGAGILRAFLAIQVLVCSVIMFVAQLDPAPRAFEAIGPHARRALFRGTKHWFSPGALKDLKSLSFPTALPDVQSAARAAMARVARFANSTRGGIRIQARARQLLWASRDARNQPRARCFQQHADQNFLFSLRGATSELAAAERQLRGEPPLLDPASPAAQGRGGWRAQAKRFFVVAFWPSAATRSRKRAGKWQLDVLPGHQPARWLNALALS
ncbi:unnamed protein product, partial [Prorocentrum cordatum]